MRKRNKAVIMLISILIVVTLSFFALAGNGSANHKVQPGESLFLIAQRYGSSIAAIKSANSLGGNRIYTGDNLIIPGTASSFTWPVRGRMSSGYGYRTHPIRGSRHFHGGIDIAVPTGTKIRAAAGGTVVWSGWVSGFGQTVVIDHHNGYKTLYGHNSQLLAGAGARVSASQVIALAGSTGNSTGPHLDFRLYLNGETVNPLKYLP